MFVCSVDLVFMHERYLWVVYAVCEILDETSLSGVWTKSCIYCLFHIDIFLTVDVALISDLSLLLAGTTIDFWCFLAADACNASAMTCFDFCRYYRSC
jgi:hypothetical protein